MHISIILAHPDPKSLNHAVAFAARDTCRELGHDVVLHDLYTEAFDPLLPAGEIPRDGNVDASVARHCEEAARADGFIIVHPNWWGMPPAVLVGWVDRVIRPDVAYRFEEGDGGEGVPVGLLKARTALVLNTSNTAEERENKIFGDPLERIWKDCIFDLCGVRDFHRRMFRIVCTSTAAERAAWLEETRQAVAACFQAAG